MRAAAAWMTTFLAMTAEARERHQPQPHEWNADVDITVSELSNAALIAIQYIWTPETLNRYDEVVPQLRRFVRHPSSLTARVRHDGNSIDTRTAIEAGGTLHLFDGIVYASGLGGIERDQVRYNFEHVYWTVPFQIEVGGRPHPLLSLGAYYRGRPIFDNEGHPDYIVKSYRDGNEQELGGVVTGSAPGDQLLASLRAGTYRADWTYEGFNPGPLDVRGYRAKVHLSWQTTSTMSWTLDLLGRREDWDNGRPGEASPDLVGDDLERRLWGLEGDLGFLYWFKGRLAFNVSVGGGFETEPPIYYENYRVGTRGLGRLGFGFTARY